jgi:hypothetical protein
MLKRQMFVFIAVGLMCIAGYAQQTHTLTEKKEPEYVNHTNFKSKIIELKHRNPREIQSVVSLLGSGAQGARISWDEQYKTLTVRDYPENIATIEEAVKRLDVPQPPKPNPWNAPDIEVTGYLLIASQSEASATPRPAQLENVLKQLEIMLSYKSYQLLSPIVQRVSGINGKIDTEGLVTFKLPETSGSLSAQYRLVIQRVSYDRDLTSPLIKLSQLHFELYGNGDENLRAIGRAKIETALNLRDGEKVVVGTASLRDKALVLVLTAKALQ